MLLVKYHDRSVGTLAAMENGKIAFEYADALDELYILGGTSGGARPKIMTEWDQKEWIIKFTAHVDGKDAEIMECA